NYEGYSRHTGDVVDVVEQRRMVLQVGLQRASHNCAGKSQGIADPAIFAGGQADAITTPGIPLPAHPVAGQRLGDRRLRLRRDAVDLRSQWRRLAGGGKPSSVIVDEIIGVRLAVAVIEARIRP